MQILQFLNTLENTLEQIHVNGRDDINRMDGIFLAIDGMRRDVIAEMQKDGEEDGRQVDKRTDPSNDSKQ